MTEPSQTTEEPVLTPAIERPGEKDVSRPSEPGSGRIDGLDGLRALAVVVVLMFHLWPTTFPGGFIGVDVFFVISGFLITTLLLREHNKKGRIKLSAFWHRRAKRLLPALVLVVFTSVAAAWLVSEELLVSIRRQVISALTFSYNWVEVWAGSDYFADSHRALFVTFWSLAVEEQFYVFWPLLLVGVFLKVSPAWRAIVALAAAAGSALLMAWWFDPNSATRVYYGTDTHSFGLMIGVGLAFAFAGSGKLLTYGWWQRLRPWMGFAAVAGLMALVAIIDSEYPFTYRGGLVLASALSAAAVATLPGGSNSFTRLCEVRPIAWIGERSYGIYLWHWPVLLIVNAGFASVSASLNTAMPAWITIPVVVALTFVLSWASFRWIEMPIRENGFGKTWASVREAFRPKRGLLYWPVAAAAVVAMIFTAACVGIITAPEKSQAQIAVEEGERAIAEQNAQNAAPPANGTPAPGESGPAWPKELQVPTGDHMVGLGDSVMSGAAPAIYDRFPGIYIDAKPILQWHDAPGKVRQMLDKGTMRRVVVLNFGTNAGFKEPASEQALRDILNMLGPTRRVVLINTVGVSYWIPEANAKLQAISSEYPNTIVADWNSVIQSKPNLLHRDRTHPNDAGIIVYANVIADALATLGPG